MDRSKLEPQWYDGTEPRPTVLQRYQHGSSALVATTFGGVALVFSLVCGYAAHANVTSRGGPFLAVAVLLLLIGTTALWIGKRIPRYVLERSGVVRFRYRFDVVDVPIDRLQVAHRVILGAGAFRAIERALVLVIVRQDSGDQGTHWLLLDGELDKRDEGLVRAEHYVTAFDRALRGWRQRSRTRESTPDQARDG